MEFYAIITDGESIKNKIIERKIRNCIRKFPKSLIDFLTFFDIRIAICNMKDTYGVVSKGSYVVCSAYNANSYLISIDNTSIHGVEKTLCHEIGHFIDDIMGCIYNEKAITHDNTKKYKLSFTNIEYQETVRLEHDFFVQYERSPDEKMDKHDYAEIFADSYAELLLGIRCHSLLNTKRIITKYTKPIIENYVNDKKIAI